MLDLYLQLVSDLLAKFGHFCFNTFFGLSAHCDKESKPEAVLTVFFTIRIRTEFQNLANRNGNFNKRTGKKNNLFLENICLRLESTGTTLHTL